MAIVVQLNRANVTPWGFRLTGGAEHNQPLTITKVEERSIAHTAGLRDGDILLTICGQSADGMSHGDAHNVIVACADRIDFSITRNRENLFQTPMDSRTQLQLTDASSRCQSPFETSSKPYRPFSTEPVEGVPPVEEPIILNPSYCDDFTNMILKDFEPPTRFKLEISKQYRPDSPNCRQRQISSVDDILKNNQVNTNFNEEVSKSTSSSYQNSKDCLSSSQQFSYLNGFQMEESTSNLYETSKVHEASHEFSDFLSNMSTETKKSLQELSLDSSKIDASLLVEIIDKTADHILKSNSQTKIEENKSILDSDVSKIIENCNDKIEEVLNNVETTQNEQLSSEKLVSSSEQTFSQQVLESISDSHDSSIKNETKDSRLLESTTNELRNMKTVETSCHDVLLEQKSEMNETCTQTFTSTTQETAELTGIHTSMKQTDGNASSTNLLEEQSQKGASKTFSEIKEHAINTAHHLAEQKSYTLGLQTVPSIKGTITPSYHYDLLLKTFFVHLTDVMVALSGIILRQPNLQSTATTPPQAKASETTQTHEILKNTMSKNTQTNEENVDLRLGQQNTTEEITETVTKKTISRLKCDKMDAIINEFTNKLELDDHLISSQNNLEHHKNSEETNGCTKNVNEENSKDVNIKEQSSISEICTSDSNKLQSTACEVTSNSKMIFEDTLLVTQTNSLNMTNVLEKEQEVNATESIMCSEVTQVNENCNISQESNNAEENKIIYVAVVEDKGTITKENLTASLKNEYSEIYAEETSALSCQTESSQLTQKSLSFATTDDTKSEQTQAFINKTKIQSEITADKNNADNDSKNIERITNSQSVPQTPLTDEYVFRLQIKLDESKLSPIPHEPSPEKVPQSDHEDFGIIKKKLFPHIDTVIESKLYSERNGTNGVTNGISSNGVNLRRPSEIYEESLSTEHRKSLQLGTDNVIYGQDNLAAKNSEISTGPVSDDNEQSTKSVSNGFLDDTKPKLDSKEISSNGVNLRRPSEIYEENLLTERRKSLQSETNTVSNGQADLAAKYSEISTGLVSDVIDQSTKIVSYAFLDNIKPNLDSRLKQMIDGEDKIFGTNKGILNGLENILLDDQTRIEMGKAGLSEDTIAELISGESEMLREAHLMGLKRVLTSHMHRVNDDDSGDDIAKIKPQISSLKDSEVLKALNDEIVKAREEKKKKEERRWTTFLQKPNRPIPPSRFGFVQEESKEGYQVKIVKQPKPRVAPDYKPEDFETGPLPWEQRAAQEPPPKPIVPEEPILIPEGPPKYLEAVDPLPESAVPDLEDTGIQLPQENPEETTNTPEPDSECHILLEEATDQSISELDLSQVVEETNLIIEEMEQDKLAEQILGNIQNMVDPNASMEEKLVQMRAQLAALAHLPQVIQQTLELVTDQLTQLTHIQEPQAQTLHEEVSESKTNHVETAVEQHQEESVNKQSAEQISSNCEEITQNGLANEMVTESHTTESKTQLSETHTTESKTQLSETHTTESKTQLSETRCVEQSTKEEITQFVDGQMRMERQHKAIMEELQFEHEQKQLKQRPTSRVGKPKPVFGPLTPQERPMVLPGGRRWRKPEDAYNEEFIRESLNAQAEIIMGKAMGINFRKFEKPEPSLDHLKDSAVYKLIHDQESSSMRRVDMLGTVLAESDYREKCRSVTPTRARCPMEQHLDIPEQVQP